MTQTAQPSQPPQPLQPPPSPDVLSTDIQALQAEAGALRLKVSDLEARRDIVGEQRAHTPPLERSVLDKAWGDVRHELAATTIQLDQVNGRLADLQRAREMQVATTLMPPSDPFLKPEQITNVALGGFFLMIPLVLALARRIWVRGGRGAPVIDFDSSPRLQRMEQAIESIAIEVERIGEAQRFNTRILTERQSDPVANRIAPAPAARREVGSITPH